MKTKQEKSSCCQAEVRRFGGRRRQCVKCKRTWRVWKAKPGRKKLRIAVDVAHRFIFHRSLPLRSIRTGKKMTLNKRAYRLSLSRSKCAKECLWPKIPKGKLIVIADALVKYVGKAWHTWYFILVRDQKNSEAVILPPFHRKGTETSTGWGEAFDTVEKPIIKRVVALVCDGHRGLVNEARWQEWLLQRCHFHLIARIQSRRSKWRSSQHFEEGKHIYDLTKKILTADDESLLKPIINELEEIGWHTPSRDLKSTLKGFINHYQDFRTYIHHPNLRLPTTNNTAESLNGLIEEVSGRARGWRSLKVLSEWIICICKTRQKIRCAPAREIYQPD